jgi:hypothetical protein
VNSAINRDKRVSGHMLEIARTRRELWALAMIAASHCRSCPLAPPVDRQPSFIKTRSLHLTRVIRHIRAMAPQGTTEFIVRSELIFRARETVDNKYKLCLTTAKSTRLLHIATTNTTDTINDALTRIAGSRLSPVLASPLLIVAAR